MKATGCASIEPASRRSVIAPRIVALFGVVILVAAVACGDPYKHTNPYDPAYQVLVTVVGPDSLFSYNELGQYGAVTAPVFPDTAFRFASSDSSSFPPVGGPAGTATFRNGGIVAPPLWPATRTVTVSAGVGAIDTLGSTAGSGVGPAQLITVWRHSGYKLVTLTQRVVRIQLRCPDTHACDTLAAGGTWSVWADGFDALGQPIVALHSPAANPATGTAVATFVVRDTTIASVAPVGIRAATVTARKSGSTWIVATRNSLLDSLQLTVR
jgi:hypothetical protein